MRSRERIAALLNRQNVDRLPVMPITMMFAADLIKVPFGEYARDYRHLVEGQIRVAETFGFDYVNTMSDPAREAADCGATVAYFPDQPPAFIEEQALLAAKSDLSHLKIPDPLGGGRMHNGILALASFKERVGSEKWIEGWVEGPCAQAADLRGINTLMLDFFDDPAFVRDLFAFVVELELRFARAQIRAGADAIGVGDAAASLVGPALYEEFVWPYEKQLIDGLHALGTRVRLHICGNTRFALGRMGQLGCDIVDLDSLVPIAEGRAQMGAGQIILGNLNPVTAVRHGTPASIQAALADCAAQAGPAFIVGAGCEIPRGTPPENVHAFAAFAAAASTVSSAQK